MLIELILLQIPVLLLRVAMRLLFGLIVWQHINTCQPHRNKLLSIERFDADLTAHEPDSCFCFQKYSRSVSSFFIA